MAEKTYDEKCAHAIHLNYITELIDINKHTFITWEGNNNTDIGSLLVLGQTPKCEFGLFLSSKDRTKSTVYTP